MRIDTDYPAPPELYNNEKRFLEFLVNQPIIAENFNELYYISRNYYDSLDVQTKRKNSDINFNFEGGFSLETKNNNFYFSIGSIIISRFLRVHRKNPIYNYEYVTYYLAICQITYDGNYNLLRKYHFDYQVPNESNNSYIPIFHLQYAGVLSPKLKEKCPSNEHMAPWLSEPRLQYTPMTLALLLDIVFNEFSNEITHHIKQNPDWIKLIKKSEELVLKPYFNSCNRFFNNRGNRSKQFISGYCYGKH